MELFDFPGKEVWSKLFGKRILQRGQEYQQNGAVKTVTASDDESKLSAKVKGSKMYTVTLTLGENRLKFSEMRCTCPYAEDGNRCKHMAALLFAVDEMKGAGLSVKSARSIKLEKVIGQLSVEDLRRFLTEAAQDDEDLQERLLLSPNEPLSPKLLAQWTKDVKFIVKNNSDRYGWVEDFYGMTCDLCDFLEEKIVYMNRYGAKKEAFELVCFAYDTVAATGGGDTDEYIDFFERCADYWYYILRGSTVEMRRAVYPWFEKHDINANYEYAFNAMINMDLFPDEEFLPRELAYIEQLQQETEPQWEDYFEQLEEHHDYILGKFLKDTAQPLSPEEQLIREEKYQELFEAVSLDTNGDKIERYEPILKEHFPVEMRDLLLARADRLMSGACDRKGYAYAIETAKRIKDYPEGAEMLAELVRRWKASYRRPAMLAELEKAGL